MNTQTFTMPLVTIDLYFNTKPFTFRSHFKIGDGGFRHDGGIQKPDVFIYELMITFSIYFCLSISHLFLKYYS